MKTTLVRHHLRWKMAQTLRRFIQSIDSVSKAASKPGAVYLLPTSRIALRYFDAVDLDDSWAVIGDKRTIPAKHARRVRDPASAIRDAACSRITNAVSFADQHVDSHVASIFDSTSGEYISGVELVICQHLKGGVFSPFFADAGIASGIDAERVVNLLRNYYQQCDQLGDDWLARSLQKRRHSQERDLISDQISSFVLSSVLNSEANIADQSVRNSAFERALRLRGLAK